MPLSEPVEREHIHTRVIDCRGYRRSDGLWDIEGQLTDKKTYDFENRFRGTVEAGSPVHDMWIRLTLTEDLEVTGCEAITESHPFRVCPDIAPDYSGIVGTSIRPGWTRTIGKILGKEKGCTHLSTLLRALAITAVQTILPLRKSDSLLSADAERKPPHLDSCHALRSDGPLVEEMYPKWYRR
jgi:hypothetical protein